MRQGSNLYYFVADHLGSTSVTLDTSGNKIDEMKYYPFGETRSGSSPTDRQFTGQRAETGLGSLYDYNARMYSPVLGRFISPDTVVPDTKNPQAWNRYAYVVNNPLKYNDPSGHCFLVCGLIGAAVGLVGYTAGAIINQSGWNVGDAALTSGTGFVVGATLGTAAPLVMGAGAEVLASAGAATGSTTLAAAATTTWAAGTSLAAVDGIALKMVADRLSQIRQMNFAPSSPVPSVPGLGTSSSGDSTALTNYWPSNRGFYGETTRTHLMPGEVVDRYGYEGGTFVSPQGTAFETRALPSESLTKPFHTYQVMKPIEAVSGVTTPAFGQIGFGTAYELPRPISILLKRGFLQEIIP